MARLRPLLPALALAALAACQATPETVKRPSTPRASAPSGGGSPTPFPLASGESPAPSLAPGESPGFSPFPGASASPAPSPSVDPLAGLSADSQAIAKALLPVLAAMLRRDFELARAMADGRFPEGTGAAGFQGSPSARALSDQGQSLLGKPEGAAFVGDSAYRLQQALLSPGPLALEAQVGEKLEGKRLWLAGGESRHFVASATQDRVLHLDAQGKPRAQVANWVLKQHAGGAKQEVEEDELRQDAQGQVLARFNQRSEFGPTGTLLRTALREGYGFFTEAQGAVSLRQELMAIEWGAKTGSYRMVYPKAGWVESGTLKDLAPLQGGRLAFERQDPLGAFAGESSLKDGQGITLLSRTQSAFATGERTLRFPAQGAELKLKRVGDRRFAGDLVASGATVASAEWSMGRSLNANLLLRFPEAKDAPVSLAYGWATEAAVAEAPSPSVASVLTLAGGDEAAHQDGAGAQARFRQPRQIARSTVDAALYYVVDGGGHRVRTLRFGANHAVTVGTWAGTGASGSVNGAAPVSSFESPFGLAVGPNDDLYVAEGKRVRLVRKKNTGPEVSTFAGQGLSGSTAFNLAAGLCLSPEGVLYVADGGSHQVFAYGTSGAEAGKRLATYGSGQEGGSDGAASVAKFHKPIALALKGAFLYVAEQEGRRIRRIALDEPAHTVTTLTAAPADRTLDRTDGPLPQGPYGFAKPGALLARPDGSVVFGAEDLRAILPEGTGLRSLAGGPGGAGFLDGAFDAARFQYVFGLCEGPDGALLVADGTRVRALVPAAWSSR